MATARELLNRKGRRIFSVPPTATAHDSAKVMCENGIGAVLVLDGDTLVGIFTERDALRRVVVPGHDPRTTSVSDVMTKAMVTCVPDTSLDECGAIMTTRRIRHLPVVDETGLHGLVSIGDLLATRVAEQEDTIKFLNDYMFQTR
jgi:CBS domain-containing protein